MTPFAFWLSWSALWLDYSARWWAVMLQPPELVSHGLTHEERQHLEELRQRFAAEIAERRHIAPDGSSRGSLTS